MKKDILIRPIAICVLLLCVLLAVFFLSACRAAQPSAPAVASSETEEPADIPASSDAELAPAAQTGVRPLDLTAPHTVPDGVTYADGAYAVTSAGTYRLTGSLEGSLTVAADGPVELILAGVSITGPDCVRVLSPDPVTITAESGTVNVLSDSAADTSGETSAETAAEAEEAAVEEEEDASGAVVYSKAPLTIGGEGTLTIRAGINNGIRCKDTLTIGGGVVDVSAVNHGLKTKGALTVTGGALTVDAGADGLVAEETRLDSGTVSITGGTVAITAADDGIRAGAALIADGVITIESACDAIQTASDLTVSGGTLSIVAGGGGGNASSKSGDSFGPWSQTTAVEVTGKGLKSDGTIHISGGSIDLNTANDSIHCGTVFTMDGGHVTVCSSDDAVHADDMLVVNDGVIAITDCFEGLEAYAVEIHGGNVDIRAVNDGVNANGPEGMFGGMNQNTDFVSVSGAERTYFAQSGGTLNLVVTGSMSNMGDGIDSNGYVIISGGELIVSTFGSFMENGIDTGTGGPIVTGGMVIAGGSSAMSESFSSYSTQCCAVIATSATPANTEVTLADEDGNVLWIATLEDSFTNLQISHPDMTVGHIYTVSYNGQTTTLDFTETNRISSSRGFGFGRPF
ncbi:MAG: carbohydrate-binding domain-containing protein [Oscillospiraceae bacterium]